MSCSDNKNRLSDENIETLIEPMVNPSGNWSDYNKVWKLYRDLKRYTNNRTGLLCFKDLPPEPDTNDYPIGS